MFRKWSRYSSDFTHLKYWSPVTNVFRPETCNTWPIGVSNRSIWCVATFKIWSSHWTIASQSIAIGHTVLYIYSSLTQTEHPIQSETLDLHWQPIYRYEWFGWLQCNGVISTPHKGVLYTYTCYSHWSGVHMTPWSVN